MRIVIMLLCGVMLAGCNKVDRKDLDKVVEYYYLQSNAPLSAEESYKFLSTRSKEQISLHDFEKKIEDTNGKVISAKVLRKEEKNGKKYGLVSITRSEEENRKSVVTDTWLFEDGKWCKHRMYKMSKEADELQKKGSFVDSENVINALLKEDPFEIEAYLMKRMNNTYLGKTNDNTSIMETILAINNDDTVANNIAVADSKDLLIAMAFLNKLDGTVLYEIAATNFVERIPGLEKKLKFIEDMNLTGPFNLAKKIKYLAQLGRFKECGDIFKSKGFLETLIKGLDIQTLSLASRISYQMIIVAFASGETNIAEQIFEYSAKRAPNDEYTTAASNLFKLKNSKAAAQAAIKQWPI